MSITNKDYIRRVSETSIGISTLRGHPAGTISKVRDYLKEIDLREFQCTNPADFNKVLNEHTSLLRDKIRKLDGKSPYWGSARKALNIFLENAVYHAVLRNEYHLGRIEGFLEVPLDKQVAERLILLANERNIPLPKWRTIKGLLPENSNSFQNFASSYAKELGCSRVQLDLLLWRNKITKASNEKTLG